MILYARKNLWINKQIQANFTILGAIIDEHRDLIRRF